MKKKYDPANDDEFKELSELSNALLDKNLSEQPGFDPTDKTPAAEIALEGGRLSPRGIAEVGGVKKAEHLRAEGVARDEYLQDPEQYKKRRVQEQIIAALDSNDLARVLTLVGPDPKLRLFAASYKRGRGQQKHRPRDYSHTESALLDYLKSKVDLLSQLWKQRQLPILVYHPKNTAVRIVAEREAKLIGIGCQKLEKQINSWRRRRKST